MTEDEVGKAPQKPMVLDQLVEHDVYEKHVLERLTRIERLLETINLRLAGRAWNP